MNTAQQFNDAYNAAQPLPIQLVLASTQAQTPERDAALEALESQFPIDIYIMQKGFSPRDTMWARFQDGYTWVDAMGQSNIDLPPGFFATGRKTYDPNNPPKGSILVPDPDNCDLSTWYPPIQKPAPPTPKPAPVGPFVGDPSPDLTKLLTAAEIAAGKIAYTALKFNDGNADGTEVTEKGRVFVKRTFWTFATTLQFYVPKD